MDEELAMDSDERLFERVRRGDLSAFDVLYARYEGPLFGFLLASLQNRADAEDAFHESFLNALRSASPRFEQGGFRSWLYRIARNIVLNRRRKGARGAAAVTQLEEPQPIPTASEQLVERERRVALDSAVSRLPLALAEVYRLRVSGLSYDEIANVLETPVGTVKSRMHEMVKVLREEMRPWTARG
jgi:RNA polymerase sigma-70 factor (ECF subfamily)